MSEETKIDNVRFSEAIYLGGKMDTNYKAGRYNGTVIEQDGGVLIDLPPDDIAKSPRFVTFVPYAKIKQIEFKVS